MLYVGGATQQSLQAVASTPENLPFISCACCGQVMDLVRKVARQGLFPELHVFVCPSCGEVEPKQCNRSAEVKVSNEGLDSGGQ